METLKQLNLLAATPLVLLVKGYQKTLSPDHGWFKANHPHGFCKFYPTCSAYAVATLEKQGLLGIPKVAARIVSCNPFSLGGVDLPYKGYKAS